VPIVAPKSSRAKPVTSNEVSDPVYPAAQDSASGNMLPNSP